MAIQKLVPVLVLLSLLCGCGKFNIDYIFPFDPAIRERAQKIPGGDAYECNITPKEFAKLKEDVKEKFQYWTELPEDTTLYSQDLQIDSTRHGKYTQPPVYARGRPFDGFAPVIVYYPEQSKLLYIVADGIDGAVAQ